MLFGFKFISKDCTRICFVAVVVGYHNVNPLHFISRRKRKFVNAFALSCNTYATVTCVCYKIDTRSIRSTNVKSAVFHCHAVLGAALVNVQNGFSFIESIAYGFAAAIGFTMAIVVFAGVRVRLRAAEPPKCFKGMPLALVTAGLIAMAFLGFSGMSIG